ncbi:MAG: hypothetical protein ACRCTE_02375 [Cellulosilyticaceae bacterium]
MRYEEDEVCIREALGQIHTPEYDFKRAVREKTMMKERPLITKRKLNVALIAAIIVILSGTVIARTLPHLHRLRASISPEMGAILQPIEVEDEASRSEQAYEGVDSLKGVVDQGIEIKPLAVVNDEDMVIIYLTIQDLEEDRINETLSIGEYFVEGGTIHNAQVIDYDEESQMAIVQVTSQGGSALNHKSMEVAIGSLTTSKKEIDQLPINLQLNNLPQLSDSETVWMTRKDTQGGGGSGDMWNVLEEAGRIRLLKPNQIQLDIPEVEGVTLTNVGFIDGKLHLQTKWEENDKNRRGYFYLTNQKGEKIKIKENNFYFGVDQENKVEFGRQYVEYILDINQEDMAQFELRGYFAEDGAVIEGEWRQKIDLDAVGEIIKMPCDIEAEDWLIKELSLSPLGVTLNGVGKAEEKIQCSLLMTSGEVRGFDSTSTSHQMGDIIMKFGVAEPIDVTRVASIQIGENVIQIK